MNIHIAPTLAVRAAQGCKAYGLLGRHVAIKGRRLCRRRAIARWRHAVARGPACSRRGASGRGSTTWGPPWRSCAKAWTTHRRTPASAALQHLSFTDLMA